MARPKQSAVAIQPAQGKRKTFDEDGSEGDQEDFPVAGPSRVAGGDEWEDYSEEDDDDEAPEAVSVGAAKKGLKSRDEEIESTQKSKRDAAAARSKAIADAKAAARSGAKSSKSINKPNPAGTKRKAKAAADESEEEEEEDADAKRLRKRMEAAMAAGDGDSEDEDGEGDDGDSFHTDSEEGEGSFHTGLEEEEGSGDEDESDAESDSSETLKDGPISDKERSMRAQMQAMMEAAEARSGVTVPAKAKKAEAATVKSALKKGKRSVEVVEEEEENFDLAPLSGLGRPLSAKVLRAAVEEEEARKGLQTEAERIAKAKAKELKQDKRKRRKVDAKESVKQLSNGKHLQLLERELSTSGSGLPPIMPARSTRPAGVQSRTNFFKTAMKGSGMVPGKALGDGRRRPIGQ